MFWFFRQTCVHYIKRGKFIVENQEHGCDDEGEIFPAGGKGAGFCFGCVPGHICSLGFGVWRLGLAPSAVLPASSGPGPPSPAGERKWKGVCLGGEEGSVFFIRRCFCFFLPGFPVRRQTRRRGEKGAGLRRGRTCSVRGCQGRDRGRGAAVLCGGPADP
jgi:hypothetical protein